MFTHLDPKKCLGSRLATGRRTVLVILILSACSAHQAAALSSEYRLTTAVNRFNAAQSLAVAVSGVHWQRVRGFEHLEFSTGGLVSGSQFTPFVSAGPVWRRRFDRRLFLSLSVSPTLLGRSHLNGDALGGHFHFTSALTLGRRFGQGSIALRLQHTSNASLRRTNPGLDMIGLAVSFSGEESADIR